MSDEERGDGEDRREINRDPVEFGPSTPPLEWLMAGIGALLALGVIGALVVGGTSGGSGPPAFTTEVVRTVDQSTTTLMVVDVANTGQRAATAVTVRAAVDGRDVAEAQIDHLPRGATETVGLLLEGSRGADDATVRVVGFTEP